jgi:predicted metal-dependent enzyme (double-stranded beta helix superfamily)
MSLITTLEDQISVICRQEGSPEQQFNALRGPLEHFLRNPGIDAHSFASRSGNLYARYLLSDPSLPAQVVLALWRPGADSPIHDHQGLTGAVGLLSGSLVETKYELVPDGDGFRIGWQGGGQMQPGLASPIYPTGLHQMHRMYNPGVVTAATIHLYLGKLTSVKRYLQGEDGLLRPESRELWFDNV